MEPIGQNALWHNLALQTPAPHVKSFAAAGARRTEVRIDEIVELYPRQYKTDDSHISNLRFALRYEPIDMGVVIGALRAIGAETIQEWVQSEPTGSYARRAWFLYEYFTGERLALPNVTIGNYVSALDPEKNVTSSRENSPRHRVINNLLGGPMLCPTVRVTPKLTQFMASDLSLEARRLTESYDPAVLARAVNYLYTKETKSSFALEGETPNATKAERFVSALKDAYRFNVSSKQALIDLQSQIVDERYAAKDWRDFQNFVGETVSGYREKIHFICPRPEDVPSLMEGWMALDRRLEKDVDPVVSAALVAFSFVFIHPFEDGNGRIHRYLIHSVLSKRNFGPSGIIFPVSASIVRDRRSYDTALEGFSNPLFDFIEYYMDEDAKLVVQNQTAHLYRYFDATSLCEYLYERVEDAVHRDLKEELGFMDVFDRSKEAVSNIVDMPDKRASLLVRLMLQNSCKLSNAKRDSFSELTDEELGTIEAAIRAIKSDSHDESADMVAQGRE